MKAIDGIDLKTELAAVQQQELEEQKQKLRVKIMHIRGQHSEAAGSVRKLRKDLEKAEASLAKHQARLAKLEAGDWSVLDEEKDQKQGNQTPAAE